MWFLREKMKKYFLFLALLTMLFSSPKEAMGFGARAARTSLSCATWAGLSHLRSTPAAATHPHLTPAARRDTAYTPLRASGVRTMTTTPHRATQLSAAVPSTIPTRIILHYEGDQKKQATDFLHHIEGKLPRRVEFLSIGPWELENFLINNRAAKTPIAHWDFAALELAEHLRSDPSLCSIVTQRLLKNPDLHYGTARLPWKALFLDKKSAELRKEARKRQWRVFYKWPTEEILTACALTSIAFAVDWVTGNDYSLPVMH